jgi:hypothetical protein
VVKLSGLDSSRHLSPNWRSLGDIAIARAFHYLDFGKNRITIPEFTRFSRKRMVIRKASEALSELSKGFPIVSIMGPRQSGKTTLARAFFLGTSILALRIWMC